MRTTFCTLSDLIGWVMSAHPPLHPPCLCTSSSKHSSSWCCSVNPQPAQSPRPTYPVRAHYPLTIYANGYRGWIAISSHDSFFFLHGDTTLTIKPDTAGQYYLNTGTTKGDCFRRRDIVHLLDFQSGRSAGVHLSHTVGYGRSGQKEYYPEDGIHHH